MVNRQPERRELSAGNDLSGGLLRASLFVLATRLASATLFDALIFQAGRADVFGVGVAGLSISVSRPSRPPFQRITGFHTLHPVSVLSSARQFFFDPTHTFHLPCRQRIYANAKAVAKRFAIYTNPNASEFVSARLPNDVGKTKEMKAHSQVLFFNDDLFTCGVVNKNNTLPGVFEHVPKRAVL